MAKMKESASSQKDVALDEMLASTAKDANEQAIAKTLEKHEQLCELSRALAVLASASVRRHYHTLILFTIRDKKTVNAYRFF